MTQYDDLLARARTVLMANYGPPPLALVRGEGTRVWDSEGREYLDLVAGIAVCAIGHAHPRVIDAVTTQLRTLGHVSNLFLTEPAVLLAERLRTVTGLPTRAFFCNSGAEANEAALKLVRRAGRAVRESKIRVVATEGGFHGRTLGALSLTGQPAKRAPFEPLPGGVDFVPYGDAAALTAAVGPDTAAIFLEPVQGENGVVPPPAGYLAAARAAADAHEAMLVLDEVQTGVGRTGAWFAFQHDGVAPDVITLAKGLGGGIPIGACLAVGDAGATLVPGDHGSTFGGNPVACAAALAVLDVIESEKLVQRAATTGDRFAAAVESCGHPLVAHVRGRGLLRAIVLSEPVAKRVQTAAQDAGFLVNAVAESAIRLAPPLVIADADLDSFVVALPGILDAAAAVPVAG